VIVAEVLSEPSDLDIAFQTILAVTERNAARDPYAPAIEILTYDMETISEFGTPAELRLEISEMNKCAASTRIVEHDHSHE
jgi:hypothetical protein